MEEARRELLASEFMHSVPMSSDDVEEKSNSHQPTALSAESSSSAGTSKEELIREIKRLERLAKAHAAATSSAAAAAGKRGPHKCLFIFHNSP
jgi:hypothetical protein